jgi:hypothetical protein
VRTAINELAALVGYIVNNLNGHHIVVTADHGFLFTETARVETDKSKLKYKPDSTILAKKRYLIGKKLHAEAHNRLKARSWKLNWRTCCAAPSRSIRSKLYPKA